MKSRTSSAGRRPDGTEPFAKAKRPDGSAVDAIQSGNRHWWTSNTMSYDWEERVEWARYSPQWFDEIDRRFVHAARLFATERQPFDRLIPFEALAGRRVLEIGCGMGFHTELMVRAGALVTAIDISPTSIEATTRRLAMRGLSADVREADAECLPFEKASFDFVWSWGVIHHSSRTALIVRRISEVLSTEGEARVMVYNRESASAWAVLLWDYCLKGGFRIGTFDERLWARSDGFTARYYVREQFADLFRAFFREVDVAICGQDADAVPLPRQLRRLILPRLSLSRLQEWQARRGAFLFLSARRPF